MWHCALHGLQIKTYCVTKVMHCNSFAAIVLAVSRALVVQLASQDRQLLDRNFKQHLLSSSPGVKLVMKAEWAHLPSPTVPCGNLYLQHLCKSTGPWGTPNWIFPAGWSDIPHFTRQHGQNSVLFQRPRLFEGTLATALTRSDAAWLFLMGISEMESLPKQTTNHRHLESRHHRRNSGSDSGRTGEDFPKYGAPVSILSARKWWPLPAHVMKSSHFLNNEVSPLQISLRYPH